MTMRWPAAIVTALLVAHAVEARPPRKRALLVGINDYSASRLTRPKDAREPAARDWANLDGTINDVTMMRGLLTTIYGFDDEDIVTLTDQQATRDAIMKTIECHLLAASRRGDVLLFYFSGHGSQVRNSASSEDDKLDESLVPADSRLGAEDIRDKDLRDVFNRILDVGAQLTVILDACHSGSGARNGLEGGLRHRGVDPDLRDVRDASNAPRPEDRGALILSAAQDFDLAYEVLAERTEIRGGFSWALARAIRDREPGESASDTFLRAQARVRAEVPAQDPVIAGRADARLRPLLASRGERHTQRAVIAVESVRPDGTYVLLGGWANGVTPGSELRAADDDGVRLEVTSLVGISRAEARLVTSRARATAEVHTGTLLEIARWAAPPSSPLRIWIPIVGKDVVADVRRFQSEAKRRSIRWIDDPLETTPTHLVRWRDDGWQLIAKGRIAKNGIASLADVPADASLFVQVPVPAELAREIERSEGVELAPTPESAQYLLAGRWTQECVEYAWVWPLATAADQHNSMLPLRTAWTGPRATALVLSDALARLRRVHGWYDLASPEVERSHYQLALRRARDGALVEDGKLTGEQRYRLVLRAREPRTDAPVYPRYVYVFVIDSYGKSVLLFPLPESGSVENRLPLTSAASRPIEKPPEEIPLDEPRSFVVTGPYGRDTYFLLTTTEPLTTPLSLQWSGVRGPEAPPRGPLDELLALTASGTRSPDEPIRTVPSWSLEKTTYESVPPRKNSL
jgi:uncharacterized caspase-like protein